MFDALKIKNFRLYWFGMFISLIGTWIQIMAQSWLVFDLTKSAFLLGVAGFLSTVPVFFLSLWGGVVADRANKRNILLLTQSAFMVLAFALGVLTQFKIVTVGQIMLISLLNGIVMAFDGPSRLSVIVELVGKEYLMNAIALNSIAFNASRIIGPVLCGILVASIGLSGCFYINGVSFMALIAALIFIKTNSGLKNGKNNSAFSDIKDGLRFIKGNRTILILVTMVGVVSLFGAPYLILMPIFADQVFHVGVKGLGLLMSSSGVGAVIGALLLARLGDFKYKGRILMLSSLIFSSALILFSLVKVFTVAIIALAFIGAASVMAVAIINTILQTMVNDEFRGRVMSVFMLTFAGVMPFGSLLSGSLAHTLGVSLTVMINGIICAVFFIIINLLYPQIQKV